MLYNVWQRPPWVGNGSQRGTRVPKISRLVGIFLNATGMQVPPNIIRQCWPAQHENTPVQKLEGIRQGIVHKLDEAAMRCTVKHCVG